MKVRAKVVEHFMHVLNMSANFVERCAILLDDTQQAPQSLQLSALGACKLACQPVLFPVNVDRQHFTLSKEAAVAQSESFCNAKFHPLTLGCATHFSQRCRWTGLASGLPNCLELFCGGGLDPVFCSR